MKRIIILFAIICMAISSQAKLIAVDDSILTDNQKTTIAVKQNVGIISQYTGLGKEVGVAVNEGLSAITTQANNFANTKVGTWTMWIITYKIIGKDILRIVIGIPLFFIVLFVLLYQFKLGYITKRIRKTGSIIDGWLGKGEYEIVTPTNSSKDSALLILIAGLIADVIVLMLIIFAG